MQTSSLSIFNPNNLTEQELVDRFVVRKKEYQKIFKDIKNSDMKYPEQHYIIEAQRGYGKTTLLKRIYFAIKRDEELKERFIPIMFHEEQYSIRKLFKLFETTAVHLELESTEFIGIYDEMDKHSEDDNYEDICFKILENKLKEKNKKLILLIDNIGDILKKFKLQEQQKFREILLTSAEFRIIGASSEVLEFTFAYDKPFYDFFKQIRLKGLNSEETNDLLRKLGEIFHEKNIDEILKSNKGKIEALRRLTGGVPRTIVLLFDMFIDNKGTAFKELEELLDRVTPLYKHRMDNLSPVQQEIVDTIALNWDGITSKEIADKARMQSKEVSAQLNQLEKNSIINKLPINKKNYLYQIKERFFNIWYLMRFGGKQEKHKIQWLVYFLESWCSKKEKTISYMNNFGDYEKAEKYYLMAIDNNDTNALNNLAIFYFENNKIQNKEKALSFVKRCFDIDSNSFDFTHTLATILLWNDLIEESLEKARLFLELANNEDNYNDSINEYFILLMAKKQYNSLFKLFNESKFKLKDKFKPTYYALMYFMKEQEEQFEIEYKKAGEELEETIEEIVEEVKSLEKKYK